MNKGTLTFFCGKMAAGKSTEALEIAKCSNAVLISEDDWLASLYPNQISSLAEYVKYANRLKPEIKKLVQSILLTGSNVVMDFPANTLGQRDWLRSIYTEIEAPHQLIYIDKPDEICLLQLEKRRREQPQRSATDTAQMFHQVTKYFEAPTDKEGFNLVFLSDKPI